MDKLSSLKELLQKIDKWPTIYMFKFIVPNDIGSIARVEALFAPQAVVYRKESKNNKFISITARQLVHLPEQIVDIYTQASKIKNIIAL